ncbi:type II toxin-antitoxin system RelE/ParE family toxin [Sulfobacillus harzensis]|uniref:Type II toxin-antitoxin system RelE/ParE family toxin n=1 Tax=Sulfobacillus harzensis TaxID=2729629 RepID=A0A7Y0Q3Z6_9FIRM|nr:type II toxin-antitoxin system RelE/ParE family toxin [Sulfobacillus harzensis]NMP22699.1 type II toxin-antitoxin system RelE/ParE family toxin [Sulfobacillus harzensis]
MDKIRVTFHPAAEIELYDAALYYESQRRGLGSTFLQAIETAMDEIRENPMASPRVQGVVRSKRVRRFPYGSPILSCTPLRMVISGFSPSQIKSADRSTG